MVMKLKHIALAYDQQVPVQFLLLQIILYKGSMLLHNLQTSWCACWMWEWIDPGWRSRFRYVQVRKLQPAINHTLPSLLVQYILSPIIQSTKSVHVNGSCKFVSNNISKGKSKGTSLNALVERKCKYLSRILTLTYFTYIMKNCTIIL